MQTDLISFVLHLADNALIQGHRNSEWTGHGPILEQDIALSNIALDLIGASRGFYQYAATLINDGSTEDSLAYLRDAREFKNALLVEQPNGDWAFTIAKQFLFSSYQLIFYRQLLRSSDNMLAAIAEKSLKEVQYHLRWSSEWIIRLGDGTIESNRRMKNAVSGLWQFTGELLKPAPYELNLAKVGTGVNYELLRQEYSENVGKVFQQATIKIPADSWMQTGGKVGLHTEHLGYILAEMQFLQRAYPGATW